MTSIQGAVAFLAPTIARALRGGTSRTRWLFGTMASSADRRGWLHASLDGHCCQLPAVLGGPKTTVVRLSPKRPLDNGCLNADQQQGNAKDAG